MNRKHKLIFNTLASEIRVREQKKLQDIHNEPSVPRVLPEKFKRRAEKLKEQQNKLYADAAKQNWYLNTYSIHWTDSSTNTKWKRQSEVNKLADNLIQSLRDELERRELDAVLGSVDNKDLKELVETFRKKIQEL